jgi:hypothetical protein
VIQVLNAIFLLIENRRRQRCADLEKQLGQYTIWGSGPFGTSSPDRRELQRELAILRKKLGLPQETNWLVTVGLRASGLNI